MTPPNGNNTSSGSTGKGRKIGTQERPLGTGYYDILGVPVNATTDDVKKAYSALFSLFRRPGFLLVLIDDYQTCQGDLLSSSIQIKNRMIHWRKNDLRELPLPIKIQTLSDDTLRWKYNEFGLKESAPEGGYVDPEEVFGAILGGERLFPIIGNISVARDMKAALQERGKREEKERIKAGKDKQKAAEASVSRYLSLPFDCIRNLMYPIFFFKNRKRLQGRRGSTSLSRIWCVNWGSLQNRLQDPMIQTCR